MRTSRPSRTSNCDNSLAQGQLLQVAISGAQQGQIVNSLQLRAERRGRRRRVDDADLRCGDEHDLRVHRYAHDHTQTQSQAIVALNATILQYQSSWQLPFEASVLDSDWGTSAASAITVAVTSSPTPDHAPGSMCGQYKSTA
jgi:hypothetical protein